MSDEINKAIQACGMTIKDAADEIGIKRNTMSTRLRRGYFRWTLDELGKLEWLFARNGYNLPVAKTYDYILNNADRFEDLLEYLPLNNKEIADILEISQSQVSLCLENGFTDIRDIQKLKGLLSEYTPFILMEGYY